MLLQVNKVYIDVNNASLGGGYRGYNYTTFETISDENGNFEIEVPAVHTRYAHTELRSSSDRKLLTVKFLLFMI